MDSEADEHVSDDLLIESPTHVFPHHLPDYVVIDVDLTTVVDHLQDDFNDILVSQSENIPHLSPPFAVADDVPDIHSLDLPQLSPTRSIAEDNPGFPESRHRLCMWHVMKKLPSKIYVHKEIIKGKFNCYISNTQEVDGKLLYSVAHLDRHNHLTNTFQVNFDHSDNSATCSCMGYTRIAYPCRHVFCVYRVNAVDRIPSQYIANRWRRDILPKRIFSIQNIYGVNNNPESVLRSQILDLITDCVDVLRGDTDDLTVFANQLKEIKSNILDKDHCASNPEALEA
ncbi:hypothetical protein L1987_01795 [Smallanthus sonchifolius]|uniref:Uncharacterized protein n=1 Tax=Smallanthus sonchifolius TaxID=185202 RepID=A0ACB9K633_9ASTR|nr:hypothetical protein L1987_01795 [Smallanthus sonchifolius]